MLDVRLGRYTQSEVEMMALTQEESIRGAGESTDLPGEPDFGKIDEYVIETHQRIWWGREK